jgi:uncharacterized SAM-binding protein YcdF (DUF218 family)
MGLLAALCKFVFPGYGFTAAVICLLMGLLVFYHLAAILVKKYPKPVKWIRRAVTICLCVGLLLVAVTEGFLIEASLGDPEESCQYILVLGAKVREDGPSLSLMDRIRAAYDYLEAHPEVIAIASGGQGADEPMSEAQSIRENLIAMGIDPDRVWLEDRSASTWANLNYSLELIEEKTGIRPQKLGVVSSEYHMLRIDMMGQDCGIEVVGIPANTSRFSQKLNHFMREVGGVWFYLIVGGHYD